MSATDSQKVCCRTCNGRGILRPSYITYYVTCQECGGSGEQLKAPVALAPVSCSSVPHCVNWKCGGAPLIYMQVGDSHQTESGFFVIKADGWYCHHCGGGYGGREAQTNGEVSDAGPMTSELKPKREPGIR